MSNAKWARLRATLAALPFRVRFRCRDVRGTEPSTARWDPDEAHVFSGLVNIEWVDLNAKLELPQGPLVAPRIVDNTSALREALLAAHIPFSIVDGHLRVWGYLRPGASPQWVSAAE